MTHEYKKPTGIEVRLVMMTPKLASELIARQATNRNIRNSQVNWLVGQIKRGEWKLINNTIGIGKDGRLYDGQHRLWAVVMAETPVPMLVTYGLEEASRAAIDKGVQRTLSDELRMFYNLDYTRSRVAFLRRCVSLAAGNHYVKVVTTDEYWDLVDDFDDGINWAVDCFLRSGSAVPFRQAPVAGALAYAHKASPVAVASFGLALRDGENLNKSHPALVLRRLLLEDTSLFKDHAGLKVDADVIVRKVLRCVLAGVKNEEMARLEDSDKGLVYFSKFYQESQTVKRFVASANAPAISPEHSTATTVESKERATEIIRERKAVGS